MQNRLPTPLYNEVDQFIQDKCVRTLIKENIVSVSKESCVKRKEV